MSSVRETFVVGGFLLALAAFAAKCTDCTSREAKEAAAETTYAGQQLKCVDDEPALPRDASDSERRAANARVDRCQTLVRERWGITETARDGGK